MQPVFHTTGVNYPVGNEFGQIQKDAQFSAVSTGSITTTGTLLSTALTGAPFRQAVDRDIIRVDCIAQLVAAAPEPCRINTDDSECILLKEIPLVYANDTTTCFSLPSNAIVTRVFVQRVNVDRQSAVPTVVATTFCGDARANGMSDIFYTVGPSGARTANTAANLLPAAALFGQFNSKVLNRMTNVYEWGNRAAENAYALAQMYGPSCLEGRYSTNPRERHAFFGYLSSNASAQFSAGEFKQLSLYGIQFPACPSEGEDDCACGPSALDSEISNTNLLVTIEMDSPSMLPVQGGALLLGSQYVACDDAVHNPSLS